MQKRAEPDSDNAGGKRRYISVAYKLALAIALITIGGMTVLASYVVQQQRQTLGTQLRDYGTIIVNQLSEASKEPLLADDQLALDVMVTNLNQVDTVLGAAVLSQNGQVRAAAGLQPYDTTLPTPQRWLDQFDKQLHFNNWPVEAGGGPAREALTLVAPINFQNLRIGSVLLTMDRTNIDLAIEASIQVIFSATLLMIGLGVIVSIWAGKRLTRPLQDLVAVKQAIDEGRYQVRIKDRRHDEIGELIDAFNGMAEGLLQKRQVEMALSRYVSSNVAETVMRNLDDVSLGGQHAHATVLFADIVGFTSLSETLKPKAVAQLLNEYFSYISHATALYGGAVDKYIGDCAMLLFGVPEQDHSHPLQAVSCAMLIQRIVDRLAVTRRKQGLPVVRFRMGINSGMMLAGNLGSTDRMQFTVVGDTVNLAARFCTYADPGTTVISQDTVAYEAVRKRFELTEHKAIRLRGKKHPLTIYQVVRPTPEFDAVLNRQADELLSSAAATATVA